MRSHLFGCMLLFLGACSAGNNASNTAPISYRADPVIDAQYYGRSRASVLLRAQECGAQSKVVDQEVKAQGYPPAQYGMAEANAYHAGFAEWFTGHMLDRQTAASCERARIDPALTELFKPTQPIVSASPQSTTRTPTSQPSYCAAGSVSLLIGGGSVDADLNSIRSKCRPGDTIDIPGSLSGVIGAACDFTKPVVPVGGNVFCTIGAIKPIRVQ